MPCVYCNGRAGRQCTVTLPAGAEKHALMIGYQQGSNTRGMFGPMTQQDGRVASPIDGTTLKMKALIANICPSLSK